MKHGNTFSRNNGSCAVSVVARGAVRLCRGPTGTVLNELADATFEPTSCEIIYVSLVPLLMILLLLVLLLPLMSKRQSLLCV